MHPDGGLWQLHQPWGRWMPNTTGRPQRRAPHRTQHHQLPASQGNTAYFRRQCGVRLRSATADSALPDSLDGMPFPGGDQGALVCSLLAAQDVQDAAEEAGAALSNGTGAPPLTLNMEKFYVTFSSCHASSFECPSTFWQL